MGREFNIQKFTDTLETVNSFNTLTTFFENCFSDLDIDTVCYQCLPPQGALANDPLFQILGIGYTQSAIDKYKENEDYRINPFLKKPLLLARPLQWSEILASPDLNLREKDFTQRSQKIMKGAGVSIPVFGPLRYDGVISIGFGDHKINLSSFDILELQMACQQAHLRFCTVLDEKKPIPIALTNRESEIMRWVMCGKSNTVIADIVGISPHTVNSYMRRIYLKLDVSDRVSAAFRALALGLI